MMDKEVELAILKLVTYCQAHNWAGYDPYDALNSKILSAAPFLNFKLVRLSLTQALKRSPINVRRLMLVPKTQNPKALALFLSALIKLPGISLLDQQGLVALLIDRLIRLRSPGVSYWCWGYSFPWQTRTIVVPPATPNLVCTVFVANALLDAYEQTQNSQCLTMAVSAAEYILRELYWTNSDYVAGFSYPLPSLRSQVHNANLLGAALLYRVYKYIRDDNFLAPALKVARYSAGKQRPDGSWYYGESSSQGWIDNFHTGYNLCALESIGRFGETAEFNSCIERGFEFYRTHFFREDGAVRYFHTHTYPIDIHCVAQSIITLLTLRYLNADNVRAAQLVLQWAMQHMWNEEGFFYYRVLRLCTIRTSYMRWSQAWMLLAMATLLREAGVTHRQLKQLPSLSAAGTMAC